jgi:hypothetical protein
MRISRLDIWLPLIAVLTANAPAVAGMAPADATALLAKTQALDKRCNILASDARQELQDFVARAEIALAEMQSVQVARAALAKGRASGKIGTCGPEQAKLVKDVLDEVRKGAGALAQAPAEVEASADPAVPTDQTRHFAAAIEPKVQVAATPKQEAAVLAVADDQPMLQKTKPKPAKKPQLTKLEEPKPANLRKPGKVPQKLSQYASVAQKYYIARRCNSMGAAAIQRLYGTVLWSHKQALASNPASAIKAMLRNVEAKAGSQRCS